MKNKYPSLEEIEKSKEWKKLPLKNCLKKGLYLVRAFVPSTNEEAFFTHEIKDSDYGFMPFEYGTHYKKIK